MSLSLPTLRTWRSTIYAPSSRDVVNRAVESEHSINHRLSQQQQYQNSVTELRRRLARKASTFSLRSKSRRSERYLRELVKQEEQSDTTSIETVKQEDLKVHQVGPRSIGVAIELPASSPKFEASRLKKKASQPRGEHTSVNMSSQSSPPPVPFKRLQEIATEVCIVLAVFW